jgi:hypothetical protein
MLLPVLGVESGQLPVPDDKEILGFLFLGSLREVERICSRISS